MIHTPLQPIDPASVFAFDVQRVAAPMVLPASGELHLCSAPRPAVELHAALTADEPLSITSLAETLCELGQV